MTMAKKVATSSLFSSSSSVIGWPSANTTPPIRRTTRRHTQKMVLSAPKKTRISL